MIPQPKRSVGKYDFKRFVRGETFRGRQIAKTTDPVTGDPIPIAAARMEIRTTAGALVHRWSSEDPTPNAEIIGEHNNAVLLYPVEKSVTSQWPLGNLQYDLEVDFSADNAAKTLLAGIIPVIANITANS